MKGLTGRVGMMVIGLSYLASTGNAQRAPEPIGDGLLYTVLPSDAIPALDRPRFVSREDGDRFMEEEEPVLGVADGRSARAYSVWLLDHHEIVNDRLGELPIAVTW